MANFEFSEDVSPLLDAGSWQEALIAAHSDEERYQVIRKYFIEVVEGPFTDTTIDSYLKHLQNSLYLEFLDLGFDKRTNGFITFLTSYYTRFANQILPKEGYAYLHNAYAHGVIDNEEITGRGVDAFNNICFCPNLFIKYTDMEFLLRTFNWATENKLNSLVTSSIVYSLFGEQRLTAESAKALRNLICYNIAPIEKVESAFRANVQGQVSVQKFSTIVLTNLLDDVDLATVEVRSAVEANKILDLLDQSAETLTGEENQTYKNNAARRKTVEIKNPKRAKEIVKQLIDGGANTQDLRDLLNTLADMQYDNQI